MKEIKTNYSELRTVIISNIPVETEREFNHKETLRILQLFFLDFSSQQSELKKKIEEIDQLQDSIRRTSTFNKYYPSPCDVIIQETPNSKKSSSSEISEKRTSLFNLKKISKIEPFDREEESQKEISISPTKSIYSEDSISAGVDESIKLIDRNCHNLISYLVRYGEIKEEKIEYCQHIFELIKSEFDYIGLKLLQCWKRNKHMESEIKIITAKARKYKNRCRVLDKEIGILIENDNKTDKSKVNITQVDEVGLSIEPFDKEIK